MKKALTYGFAASVAATLALAPATSFADTTTTTTTTSTSTATTDAPQTLTAQEELDQLLPQTGLSPELQARIREAAEMLPADFTATIEQKREQAGISHTTWFEQAQGVINPDDYECAPTELSDWLRAQISPEDRALLRSLGRFAVADLPTYDALVFGQESKTNTFGIDGSYTYELNREMTSLRQFWAFDGSDIQLIPMHSNIFEDEARLAAVYETWLDFRPSSAAYLAALVHDVLAQKPELASHPYFSFNAFAYSPQDDPKGTELGITKRIVMGDGILQGMQGVGLSDKAAPLGVLAHEYGHQMQYATGLFQSDLPKPEATRRTELMADAFGTYFVVHSRGAALNAQRTLDVQKSFYNVGDCGFTSSGHHGTPNQRFKTATWAANVFESAADQGHKLTGIQVAEKFDQHLPVLLEPDAETATN